MQRNMYSQTEYMYSYRALQNSNDLITESMHHVGSGCPPQRRFVYTTPLLYMYLHNVTFRQYINSSLLFCSFERSFSSSFIEYGYVLGWRLLVSRCKMIRWRGVGGRTEDGHVAAAYLVCYLRRVFCVYLI